MVAFSTSDGRPATPASALPRRLRPASPLTLGPPRPLPPRRIPPRRGALGAAAADPLWVLDANDALVITPGVVEHEFSTWNVDLRAQVSGGIVQTYNWNLTGAPDAINVSGANTYRLQFQWRAFTGAARTNTITITTTNIDLSQQVQTLTFSVLGTDSPAWTTTPPTGFANWPTVVTPDQLTARQETVAGPYYQLGLFTGEVQTSHALPAYNPGVPALNLVYSSTYADRLPIFIDRYELPTGQVAAPPTVSAQLTLNGVAGATIYYNTALLNPGDIMHLALQADASALPTGRYNYSIAVTANYAMPVTTTVNGQVNLLDSSGSAFGKGWSLDGLARLWSVSGGVILEQPGGTSLWFAGAGPTYATPPGDFSTLVRNGDNTYTRTLKDGTKINFNTSGQQTSIVDRHNNTLSYGYTSGKLTSITDPNGRVTTLAYNDTLNPNRVTHLTDPAGRVTVLAYNAQGRLTSITDPDGAGPLPAPVTGYVYDSSNRLTQLTNPRNYTTTFVYNFAGRAQTVNRPDTTSEQLTALQLRGLAAPGTGTLGNPATAVLAVEAFAQYTDGETNAWLSRLDWLGFGQGSQLEQPLPAITMSVYHRDANGLAWLMADPLARRTRLVFNSQGNPTHIALPDDAYEDYTYNSFSQPTTYRDATANLTTYAYNATNGDLESITQPDPDGPGPLTAPVSSFTYWSDGLLKTSTDPRNNVTSYTYDTWDRLTQITYPDDDMNPANNPVVVLGYNAASNLTARTDERGFVTSFVYDNLNRLTQRTQPDDDADPTNNPRFTYGYDAASNPTTVTDTALNATTTSTYDPLDRLKTVTDPLNHALTYGYDNVGNLKTITNALNHVTTYSYDSANRLTGMTNAENETTVYGYDAAGQRTSVTQPDPDAGGPLTAPVTTYTYDLRGRPASVSDPLLNRLEYTYNAASDLLTVREVENSSGLGRTLTYTYDNLHRRTQASDALGHLTRYEYDAAGNLTRVTDPDPDGGGPLAAPVTTFTYGARNWQLTVTDPLNHTLTYGYDAAGNRTTVTDALLRTTTTVYDAQNRVSTVTQPDPDGGGPLTAPLTRYRYDRSNRLESITDPLNNVTSYTYDNANRLLTVRDPNNRLTTYGYDNANRLTAVTDRRGLTRSFILDKASRVTSEDWVIIDGDMILGIIREIAYVYDDMGRLTFASDPDSAITYLYDASSRVTAMTYDFGPLGEGGVPVLTLTSGYDGFNDRRSLSDNRNGRIDYTYDNAHRLTQASQTVSMVQGPHVTLGYDDLDRLTSLTRKLSAPTPNITSTLAYDAASRVTSIVHASSAAGTLATHTYSLYDDANQLRTYTGPEGTLNYNYDNDSQLTGTTGARTETYAYDVNGNRTSANGSSYGAPSAGNRLTSDGTYNYTYDNEGNITLKERISDGQRTEYGWDYLNRLTIVVTRDSAAGPVVQEVRFTYDLLGRRIGKRVDADGDGPGAAVQTWTAYDGFNPYADFDSAGNLTQRYLYGPGLDFLLARRSAAGDTAWYLTDRLGSVRQIVNTSGSVLYSATYDSYGKVVTETGTGGDRFKFTGREYDAEVDLYNFHERYYGPSIGRFLREDPIGFRGGDPNLHRYVYNSPTNFTDPTGLQGDDTEARPLSGANLPPIDWQRVRALERETEAVWKRQQQRLGLSQVLAPDWTWRGGSWYDILIVDPILDKFGGPDRIVYNLGGPEKTGATIEGAKVGGISGAVVGAGTGAWVFGIGAVPGAITGGLAGAVLGGVAANQAVGTGGTYQDGADQALVPGLVGGGLGGILGPLGWSLATGAFWTSPAAGWVGIGVGGNVSWVLGRNHSAQEWANKMQQRGWTPAQITEAMQNGQRISATNLVNPGNPAMRYVHPTTGRSVIVDNVTQEVIHVGGDGFLYP